MSASDNELEQYLNEFKRYTYSIGAATARVARVRVRTHLFWESNMGPAQNRDVLAPTNWTLPSFQSRRAAPPCISSRDSSLGLIR